MEQSLVIGDVRNEAEKAYFLSRIDNIMGLFHSVDSLFETLPMDMQEYLVAEKNQKPDLNDLAMDIARWSPLFRGMVEEFFEQLYCYIKGESKTLSTDEWELFDKTLCLMQKLRLKSKQQMKMGLGVLQQNEPCYLMIACQEGQMEIAFRHHVPDDTREFFFGGR